jgi:hypothetical protein
VNFPDLALRNRVFLFVAQLDEHSDHRPADGSNLA